MKIAVRISFDSGNGITVDMKAESVREAFNLTHEYVNKCLDANQFAKFGNIIVRCENITTIQFQEMEKDDL